MAKKTKKAEKPINIAEYITEDNSNVFVPIEWNGLTLNIKKRLNYREVLNFVDTVVFSCIDEDGGNYYPEFKCFYTYQAILENYAGLQLPLDTEERYALMYNCQDLISEIKGVIDRTQYDHLIEAVDDRLEHYKKSYNNTILSQMMDLLSSMSQVGAMAQEAFDGFSAEDMRNIINNIGSLRPDEEKLVKSVLSSMSGEG